MKYLRNNFFYSSVQQDLYSLSMSLIRIKGNDVQSYNSSVWSQENAVDTTCLFNLVIKEAIFQLNGYYRWTTCLQHVAASKRNWKRDLET